MKVHWGGRGGGGAEGQRGAGSGGRLGTQGEGCWLSSEPLAREAAFLRAVWHSQRLIYDSKEETKPHLS